MAPIASLGVREAKSYAGNFPRFGQPREVACFSRDEARRVTFDRASLRPYRAPLLPAALDVGFEGYVARDAGEGHVAPLDPVLDALAKQSVVPAANTIVTFRNNLNKIFLTPYQPRDDWEVGIERREDGVVLLHVRETARKAAEEANRDERGQRMAYWGYRFEQLATLTEAEAKAHAANGRGGAVAAGAGANGGGYRVPSPSDAGSFDHLYPVDELSVLRDRYQPAAASGNSSGGASAESLPAVNANAEFCSIVQLSIDKLKLLMAAEIDCVAETKPSGAAAAAPGAPVAAGYVELKTSKVRSRRGRHRTRELTTFACSHRVCSLVHRGSVWVRRAITRSSRSTSCSSSGSSPSSRTCPLSSWAFATSVGVCSSSRPTRRKPYIGSCAEAPRDPEAPAIGSQPHASTLVRPCSSGRSSR